MAEIRVNATGGLKLYDADDSHYAQIVAGTITSNVDAITLGHDTVTIADNLSLGSDSAVLKFGTDGDTTLTHTDGTGLTLNSTNKICFNDASQFIQGASATVLDIAATDEIELTATEVEMNVTTLDVNGNVDVSGTTLLPTLGVITAKDLGVGMHIRTADSGASVDGVADELVIEGSGDSGWSILTGTSASAYMRFADSDDNDIGGFQYYHGDDVLVLRAGNANVGKIKAGEFCINEDSGDVDFRVEGNGQTHALFVNGGNDKVSFNESAPDTSAGGLCLNQDAADTPIMTFKSSDIAHGMTDNYETDTYCIVGKETDVYGGVDITGVSESEVGFRARGFITTATTAKNTSSKSGVELRTMLKSGTGLVNMSSDGNLVSIYNNATARFIFDAEGSFHADVESTTFDKYDDAQLVRAFDLSHGKGTIDSKFDKFIAYNHEKLAELKLVGREDDGTPNHFVNVTGMQRLHNGAIWQQYEKHERLLEAVYDLAKEAVGEDKANAILDKHEVKRLQ